MTDAMIHKIFTETKTIACVGASANPARPSHYVSLFLKDLGYRVIGVNPGLAGQELFGETVYASLSDIPKDIDIDMIDIFRRSENLPDIVTEAISALPALKTVWAQLGVEHEGAAKTARDAGLQVVQNRCPKIEYPRLMS
ncbi:CoA-binding protein [Amylibacter kogurei]|uniref:CoA-binding protein n=1 Tax=Paramylibacter kogurei TaxID=1889778 RepID=A0A2G5K622_9RHOB|nr:CoA-binding protein [Amylibacter kogurei]PIB24463.1 CoA-binding protein [Amylibacter kogurei]